MHRTLEGNMFSSSHFLIKKETFEKIALLKELDDEVSKFRKELINKFQRENK